MDQYARPKRMSFVTRTLRPARSAVRHFWRGGPGVGVFTAPRPAVPKTTGECDLPLTRAG